MGVLKQQDMDMNNAIIYVQNINFSSLPALYPCEIFCIAQDCSVAFCYNK